MNLFCAIKMKVPDFEVMEYNITYIYFYGVFFMNVIIICFILVLSVVLFACSAIIIVKIFGTGFFIGLDLSCVTVMDDNDDVNGKINAIIDNIGSDCQSSATKVIIVDGGMNLWQREICDKYCEKYSFLEICTPDMLNGIIFSLKNKKGF